MLVLLPWWLPVALAPFVGSFLGVLVRRLPRDEGWVAGRSRCEGCGQTLGLRDLVPIASYVWLRGRCRRCGARIPPMHLAIEVAATVVAGTASLAPTATLVWAGCVLGWTLLALAWIDAGHFWLPDLLTLPLLVAGLAATVLAAPDAIADHAAAAALAYAGLRGLGALYHRLRGRAGLGQGDAKLLAASGAWLGLAALPWALTLAAVAGLLWLLGAAALHRRALSAATVLPFGPALAAATWAVWLLSVTDMV